MFFNVGDLVTRKSYNHDLAFKIIDINNDIAVLKGINIRLLADAPIDDLTICEKCEDELITEDDDLFNRINFDFDRDEYFYLPGKILHIDSDNDYLNRCMNFYKKMNILCYGVIVSESEAFLKIDKYLNEINPDILVITGHDAFFDNGKGIFDLSSYKNSSNFIKAIKVARSYEKNQDKLIIISGACQSNYEELIKAGSNFASSPKRVNIHALDPAIIASSISLSPKNSSINLLSILSKTKYGKDGIGGIITNGTMYVGYPR